MKKLLMLVGLCCICNQANAATFRSPSVDYTDVTNTYALTSDGDTLELPIGKTGWSNTLTITKAITLTGSGLDLTVISNDVPNVDRAVINITMVSNKLTSLQNMTITGGARTTTDFNGVVRITGGSGNNTNGSRFIAYNVKWDSPDGANLFMRDVIGVISHCVFTNSSAVIPLYIYHENWNGYPFSDASFSDVVNWGSDEFLYVEDCEIGFPTNIVYAITDAYRGARYVIRYSKSWGGLVEMHGTDSGGRPRGTRAVECYMNTFSNMNQVAVSGRSGTSLVWSNGFYNFTQFPQFTLSAYRSFYHFNPFLMASGTNGWDINAPGGPFESGTATSGGTYTLTDTSKSWTTNQWVGYFVIGGASSPVVETNYVGSYIRSNDNRTIYTANNGSYSANALTFTAGNAYQFWRVTESFDQPGRGRGTRLSNSIPTVIPNDQVDEPCYEWDNYYNNSGDVQFLPSQVFIRSGEHFFNNTQKPGYTPLEYPHPLVGALQKARIRVRR